MRSPGHNSAQKKPGDAELELPHRDLNPNLQNQNLSCYQLHHGVMVSLNVTGNGSAMPIQQVSRIREAGFLSVTKGV